MNSQYFTKMEIISLDSLSGCIIHLANCAKIRRTVLVNMAKCDVPDRFIGIQLRRTPTKYILHRLSVCYL